jgi:hypothetical protein
LTNQSENLQSTSSSDLDNLINSAESEIAETLDKPKRAYKKREKLNDDQIEKQKKAEQEYYTKLMRNILKFSGDFLASGSKFDGFKMSNDELDMLGMQGGEIMQEFAPVMNHKYVKLSVFTGSLLFVYSGKYISYRQHLIKQIGESENESTTQV